MNYIVEDLLKKEKKNPYNFLLLNDTVLLVKKYIYIKRRYTS